MEKANKRVKLDHVPPQAPAAAAVATEAKKEEPVVVETREVRIKFRNTEGEETGDEIMVSAALTKIDLNKILDQILSPEEK